MSRHQEKQLDRELRFERFCWALMGLYGVIVYVVARRTSEIGIRMAPLYARSSAD